MLLQLRQAGAAEKCVGKQPNRVAEGRVVRPGKEHERDEADPQRDEDRRNDEHRAQHQALVHQGLT